MRRINVALILCLLVPALTAWSQVPGNSPARWSANGPSGPVRPGERFEVSIEAQIADRWHLYSATQPPGGPNPTRFRLISGGPFRLAEGIRQSEFKTEFDANFGIPTEFFAVNARFGLPLIAAADAAPGKYDLELQVTYQMCDDKVCLPPTKVPMTASVTVESTPGQASVPAQSRESDTRGEVPNAPPVSPRKVIGETSSQANAAAPATSAAPAGTAAEVQQARASGFLPYLWLAMSMGAISLATPCVFPMIPITVSYFTKVAETKRASGLSQALVYSVGIIFTFTGLGLGLAAVLGATGINQFAANPWVNLLITAVFVGFAFNLFGMYEIGVPAGVLNRLSRIGGNSGYMQTLIMGLTFTLTSFTCTVPFVGTVLVATSQGDWLWPAFGMLGYSVVFAAPFFVLALVPQALTALPKSGAWLNSVKVTMGFLVLAAAMKFISNVDLVWNWRIFTREVVLSIWLAIAVLCTLYLLGKFQLPHDSPVEKLGVLRMSSAMVFLSLGFYLATGFLGGSLGELDAFLPLRTSGGFTLAGGGERGQELTWHRDLDAALVEARAEAKPVFISFTGYTCTNCRWMHANILSLPAVHQKLQRYSRLQLYTDGSGEVYERNQQYQKQQFGTIALPFYVIMDSQGKTLATFPGMTRKPEEFLRFLDTPFTGS